VIIAPDDGRIPWWRLLWSLMCALLIGAVGWMAVLFNSLAVASVALPLLLPLYTLGWKGDGSFWFPVGGSIAVWWAIIFGLLWKRWRRGGRHAAA